MWGFRKGINQVANLKSFKESSKKEKKNCFTYYKNLSKDLKTKGQKIELRVRLDNIWWVYNASFSECHDFLFLMNWVFKTSTAWWILSTKATPDTPLRFGNHFFSSWTKKEKEKEKKKVSIKSRFEESWPNKKCKETATSWIVSYIEEKKIDEINLNGDRE